MPSSSSAPVPFQELTGSPQFSISRRGAKAVRRFLVRNQDTHDFVETLGRGSGYSVPLVCPFLPHAYVSSVEVEQFSPDNPPDQVIFTNIVTDYNKFTAAINPLGGGAIPSSLVTATYETDRHNQEWPSLIPKPAIAQGTTLKLRTRTTGQFLTQTSRSALWSPGGSSGTPTSSGIPVSKALPPDHGFRILLPTKEFNLDWMYLRHPPTSTLDEMVGKVNSVTFLAALPGTLLFEGYDLEEDFRVSQDEPYCWTVHLNYKQRIRQTYVLGGGFKSVTWNHDYRENGQGGTDLGGWEFIIMSDGKPRYEAADFTSMLTTGGPAI